LALATTVTGYATSMPSPRVRGMALPHTQWMQQQ